MEVERSLESHSFVELLLLLEQLVKQDDIDVLAMRRVRNELDRRYGRPPRFPEIEL